MKSETLIFGMELLVLLDEVGKEISFKELEEKTRIKDEELRELLKYLEQKEYITWSNPLFIGTSERIDFISDDEIKLSHKGMEVNLDKRDYFDETSKVSQEIQNQTNVNNSSEFQVAQTTGNNSPILQTQENIQITILNKIIDDDQELDSEKKSKLKEIIKKIKEMKDSGETAEKIYGWIKKGAGICAKYGPYLWALV